MANEAAVGGLQFAAEVELMEDKFDTVFDIGDDAAASFEKFDVVVVYIVVLLQVLLDADVQLALVDDLDVAHVLVDDVFVYFSDFLAEVQEIFVVVVFYYFYAAAVDQQFPD